MGFSMYKRIFKVDLVQYSIIGISIDGNHVVICIVKWFSIKVANYDYTIKKSKCFLCR